MSPKEIQDRVMKITEETFKVIQEVYNNQKEGKPDKSSENKKPSNPPENAGSTNPSDGKGVSSRIIFPRYSERKSNKSYKGNKKAVENRISEQELRFIFVEQLNKYADEYGIYYSVETPTVNPYKFPKGKKDKEENFEVGSGKSGNTDLTIHDSKFNRICLIEFKALNKGTYGYKKDFCKLFEEPDANTCRFFIQIIDSYDDDTLESIKENVYTYMEDVKEEKVVYKAGNEKKDLSKAEYDERVHYICYYLKGPDEKHGYPDIITNVSPCEFKVFKEEEIKTI